MAYAATGSLLASIVSVVLAQLQPEWFSVALAVLLVHSTIIAFGVRLFERNRSLTLQVKERAEKIEAEIDKLRIKVHDINNTAHVLLYRTSSLDEWRKEVDRRLSEK